MPDSPFMGFSGPLYDQVHKHLRARILAGEWEHWQPLPPEVMLSQELGVSVGTVRKAMEKLMQEKIVVRERGRGTFVRRDSNERPISTLAIRDHDGGLVEPEKGPVQYAAIRVCDLIARALSPKLGPNASLPVIKFERDWRADDILICHETVMVQQQFLLNPKAIGDPSGDDLLVKYMDQYRMQVHSVRWEVGSRSLFAPDTAVAELQAPSVVITRHSLNANSDQFEICEHVISVASHAFEIVQ